MLTSIYYYQFYKPYIVKDTAAANPSAHKRSKNLVKDAMENMEDATFLLNNAMKTDVVDYVRNVSAGVVGIKDAARTTARDMEELNQNTQKWSFEQAKDWIGQDLARFVESYNRSVPYLGGQRHSRDLNAFAGDLVQSVAENQGPLSGLGIVMKEDGALLYDPKRFADYNPSRANAAICENFLQCQRVHREGVQVLKAPLTEHMRFRSLSYYYNYKYGTIEADTFKIIESGLLVDIAV